MTETEAPRTNANDLPEAELIAWYGPWEPLTLNEIRAVFDGTPVRWWVAGGRVIDAVTGTAREHGDVDVAIAREDLDIVRERVPDWQLWHAHSGSLQPLFPGDPLMEGREGLWVRRDATQPWILDLLLSPTDGVDWIFKRDHSIRLPLSEAVIRIDDMPYLAPQCVLLYKARHMRDKDRRDFDVTLPHLDTAARAWLATALDKHLPGHEWRQRL
ncbi:nucleotidyltransferase domain-containing protein [Stackebrandtia nassauensis]|uniref:Amino acid transporter n=1 Tax=Stackebrandtia nassauensis (strain DSM 44728 / CIP 108903 / NRRL B-16338 / NBRC 102104 / LLR-40K-21) TaxID=446470 RepID=D3QAQ4_STANL|nr:hypothetical protein [Stackebrandtia nassauensis]ADD44700.1 conserved hypothetical protein [Stackebrandtia nassauensis DSM 44728]